MKLSTEQPHDDICLSPDGRLYLESAGTQLPQFNAAFEKNPSIGLLHLGLQQFDGPLPAGASFWQEYSRRFIAQVCRLQTLDDRALSALPLPSAEELGQIVSLAPFMRGSEYLNEDVLAAVWRNMESALHEELKGFPGSLQQYLSQYDSRWNLVGRVCFHLAENKNNSEKPFAFVATYTPQLKHGISAQYLPLKRALQESAGKNTSELLSLLLPVQKAAKGSEFIKDLVDSGRVFEATAWTVYEAHRFLQDIPIMEASGIVVRVPNWWNQKAPPRVKAEIHVGGRPESMVGFDAMLDFDVHLALGDGVELSQEEWQELQHGSEPLVKVKGQWVEIDREKLKHVLAHWAEVKATAGSGISLADGLRILAGMQPTETPDEVIAEWSHISPGPWLQKMLEELRNPTAEPSYQKLQGTLRPYQRRGVQWLWSLYQMQLGGCLADDMGLGKTIQILSLLLAVQEKKRPGVGAKPHLLVVPASLLGNWQAEAARFAPSLRIAVVHGASEKPSVQVDVIVTTYGFLHRRPWLQEAEWDVVILDEAQSIKNPGAKQTRVVKQLKSSVRFALTGTPVENRVGDLWSIFDFTSPGLLGSAKKFSHYAKREKDFGFTAALRKLTQPYILRRLKTDKTIISDLPEKTEMKVFCRLSKEQVRLYTETIEDLAQRLETADEMQRRGLVLSSLMRLKQICNHPAHALGYGEYDEQASGKWERLRAICEEIAAKQEKVLIFTQFTEIMPHLHDFVAQIFQREGLMLHGGTAVSKRQALVQQFQQPDGPPFFLLSLKAGGTGLNLTAASHVIHFDRWWNPAVENQATDRAYRIGQKRSVLVHPFICQGTIEEKIDALITSKKKLSKELLEGEGELLLTELSNDEVLRMVSLDLERALTEE